MEPVEPCLDDLTMRGQQRAVSDSICSPWMSHTDVAQGKGELYLIVAQM